MKDFINLNVKVKTAQDLNVKVKTAQDLNVTVINKEVIFEFDFMSVMGEIIIKQTKPIEILVEQYIESYQKFLTCILEEGKNLFIEQSKGNYGVWSIQGTLCLNIDENDDYEAFLYLEV